MRNITKLLFSMLVLTASAAVFGQPSIEKNFQANLKEYSMEHFAEGEDATSGFDYLFYKSGPKVVKIRSIWSSSVNKALRVEDLFFDQGLAFLRKSTTPKTNLRTLIKGKTAVLTTNEEFYFTEGKMTRWVIKGVEVPKTDPRWIQTEKDIQEQAKSELENYEWLKSAK